MNNILFVFFQSGLSLLLLFYFMGQNPFEYLFTVYMGTAGVIVFLCVLILILSLIVKFFENKIKRFKNYFSGFVFLYFLLLDSFVLKSTLFLNELEISYGVAYIIQVIVFCIWWYNSFKIFFPVLIGLIIFNIGVYYRAIGSSQGYYLGSSISYGKMKYKPNIYFIVLESYQGNEALKKLYNYDNQDFIAKLKKMDFTVYENVYSNAPDTRSVLSSIFTINDLKNVHQSEIGKILLFPKEYKTTRTLIENGYDVEYMFPTDYLFSKDSRCESGYYINSLLFKKYFKRNRNCEELQYKTFNDFMSLLENRLLSKKAPFLFITKIGGVSENDFTYSGGIMHIPNKLRHTDKIELLPKLRKEYVEELKKENVLLKNLLEKISLSDPSGLIILVGDHGGDFFEIYKRTYSDKMLPFLQKNGIKKDDILLDFFNVFLAIKWPSYINCNREVLNTQELFKIVFEELVPGVVIPKPSSQLFDFDMYPLTDVFVEKNG